MRTENPKRIIISRTDSIGDVLLTLPLCVWLKNKFPATEIIYLCRNYTVPVLLNIKPIDRVLSVDDFINESESYQIDFLKRLKADWILHIFPDKKIAALAKKSKIKNRVGTSHRLFHFLTCNHRVSFTRKKSSLHEAQLNFHLLRPLGLKKIPSFEEINEVKHCIQLPKVELPGNISEFINKNEFIIVHPKSQGSALEWPNEKYISLANDIVLKGMAVVFTGTEKEGIQFRSLIPSDSLIIDSTGALSLEELIFLISKSKGIVACSTGPLHIGGVFGIKSVGLFSSRKPIHPGRWEPLGKKTVSIVYDKNCKPCNDGKLCRCIENISKDKVMEKLFA